MRPTILFNKTRRQKRRTGIKAYRQQSRAEYQQAEERLLLGSSGAASPVRKIDPATGAVIEALNPPPPKAKEQPC
jgi:hypothetical protein